MANAEQLGEVTAPSGVVVLLDMGLMWLWSHDRPPVMQSGRYGPETEAAANSAIDFGVVGVQYQEGAGAGGVVPGACGIGIRAAGAARAIQGGGVPAR